MSNSLPIPVNIKENPILTNIKKDLMFLKAPEENINDLANAIFISSQSTKINHKLIIALMYTESSFDKKAIGPENKTQIRYKGLMQTPTATWFSDVDTLHGARIFREKLALTKNNIKSALMLYKGGNNSKAAKQAEKVLELYKLLQTRNA
jgi:soluble lytic murein transglycosylase-like protein